MFATGLGVLSGVVKKKDWTLPFDGALRDGRFKCDSQVLEGASLSLLRVWSVFDKKIEN